MTTQPLPDFPRFWSKVDIRGDDECWPWTAYCNPSGYGYFSVGGRRKVEYAHRVAYELVVGPIPPGLSIDHVKARGCTMRNCVNPRHLEAVTTLTNNRRGDSLAAKRHRQEECQRGHEFTEENLYITPDGRRQCRPCMRDRERRRRARVES